MAEGRDNLAEEVRALADAVGKLQARVGVIEEHLGLAAAPAPGEEAEPPEAAASPARRGLGLQLAGRLLLILGGAYLLRAGTESGGIPASLGVAEGLAYALAWLVGTARAGRRGEVELARCYALATALIAFPLVWETSARFQVLTPLASALALALTVTLSLWVALRQRLRLIADLFISGTVACGTMLLFRPGGEAPIAALLVAVGLATLWLGRWRGWVEMSWIGAVGADLAIAWIGVRALRLETADATVTLTLVLQGSLFLGYVGSIVFDALVRMRRLDDFDFFQTGGALVVGFGGSLAATNSYGAARTELGVACLALAVLGYLLALRHLDRERRRTFAYLMTVSLVLVLGGTAFLLDEPAIPLAVLAAATALAGRRARRVTLGLHGALYAAAAALASGLLVQAAGGWAGAPDGLGEPTNLAMWLALAAALACAALPAKRDAGPAGRSPAGPQVVALALVAISVGGLALRYLVPALADAHPDLVAPARMLVLALTFLAATTVRSGRFAAARLLRVPLLVAGAAKLALQDLPEGTPLALALSFALYGAMLLIGARAARAAGAGRAEDGGAPPPGE